MTVFLRKYYISFLLFFIIIVCGLLTFNLQTVRAVSGDNLLSITKSAQNKSRPGSLPGQLIGASPGEIIEYTLLLENKSPAQISNARIFDRFDLSTSYIDGSASNNGFAQSGAIEWNINLDQSESISLIYQVKVRQSIGLKKIIEVSPSGQYKTLAEARDAIRDLKSTNQFDKPIEVLIHAGNYIQNESFELKNDGVINDSGTFDKPITYKAYGDGPVLISGENTIAGSWAKLDSQGDWDQIHYIDLPDTTPVFNSLFIEDNRLIRARTPNINPSDINAEYFKITNYPSGFAGNKCQTFYYDTTNDIDPTWSSDKNMEVITLRRWEQSRSKLGANGTINSTDKFISFDNPLPDRDGRCFDWEYSLDSIGNSNINARFYLENFYQALDTNGEWFLRDNGVTKTLFYWPTMSSESQKLLDGSAYVVYPKAEQLLKINGLDSNKVSDVNFDGLNFAYTDWKLPQTTDSQLPPRYYSGVYHGGQSARENHYYYGASNNFFLPPINISQADRIGFLNNKIYHVGGYGLYANKLRNSNITNNQMFDLGSGGIAIGEWNCDTSNVCETDNNILANNLINDYGKVFFEGTGIWVKMARNNLITHNEVSNGSATGISAGWNWSDTDKGSGYNEISYNHIWSVMKTMYDGGGIYTLGKQLGTVVRYNLIHDIATANPRGNPLTTSPAAGLHAPKAFGIYLDQGSDLIEASYNLVFDTSSAFMRNFDSQDTNPTQNLIENNIFVVKSYEHDYAVSMAQKNTFRKNVVFIKNNILKTSAVFHLLREGVINGSAWDNNQYYVENRNLIAKYWSQGLLRDLSMITSLGVENNSLLNTDDPKLIGPLDGDYRHYLLQSSSPIISKGFDKTNFDQEIQKAGRIQ